MGDSGVQRDLERLLEKQTGIGDPTLAAYVLNLGRQGKQHLHRELSDFPREFVDQLDTVINGSDRPDTSQQIYSGIVVGIKPAGLLIKVAGLNKIGLVPTHQHGESTVQKGQRVRVKVLKNETGRLILELEKQLFEVKDPFELKQMQAAAGHPPVNIQRSHEEGFADELEPEHQEISLIVNKHIPKFLEHEGVIESPLTNPNRVSDLPEDNETWLSKSARVTGGKVSEATLNSRNAPKKETQEPQRVNSQSSRAANSSKPEQDKRILPVHKFRKDIMQAVASSSVVVIVGDTGSGKTTQITQFLHDGGYSNNGKVIACTQPRRLAAISIAQRVSSEMNCPKVGGLVGYSVRFDDCTSKDTEVKFMTDGILQREIISDPDLSKYSAIMLDEAHERTVATDVLFALLKSATTRRPDLRVIVTSATLDAERFAAYFGGAPILRIPGRTFPVDIKWAPEPVLDYMEAALATVKHIHNSPESEGDILVFLTGQAEIDLAVAAISKTHPSRDLIPIPVYAAIPSEMQSLIFNPAPAGRRKVVFATNIAETSLTIDGITFVVDPGFSKIQVWDANKGMGVLQVQPISQAQANQRSGRAGRTAPGVCYRLYTKRSFENEMPKSTVPEIQRGNLGHTVLGLKAMGVQDIMNFDFIDKPSRLSMLSSLHELFLLGALDENSTITKLGIEMAAYPLDPTLAKVLVTARQYGEECLEDVLIIIAMMSMPNVFYRPSQPPAKQLEADRAHRHFQDITGDHITLLRVFKEWDESSSKKKWCDKNYIQYKTMTKVQDARQQLSDLVNRDKSDRNNKPRMQSGSYPMINKDTKIKILKCLCSGFFQNVAKSQGTKTGSYTTLNSNITVNIHPSSSLFKKDARYILYSSLILTSKEYMHIVSEIKPEWLISAVPDYYQHENNSTSTNPKKRQGEDSLQPLYRKYATHENEWKVSEHRKTLFTKRRG